MSYINYNNMLPLEILLEIFKYFENPKDLGKCTRVCLTWKKTIDDHPELWKNLLLKISPHSWNSTCPKRDIILHIQMLKAEQCSAYDRFFKAVIEVSPGISALFTVVIWYHSKANVKF